MQARVLDIGLIKDGGESMIIQIVRNIIEIEEK